MKSLRIINPLTVTDSILVSSNLAEADYAAWNAATAYSVGNRVIRTSTHRIYERIVAGTTATPPESDSTNWRNVSATNKWKCFDQINTTQTTSTGDIGFIFNPQQVVNSVAFLNIHGASVRVKMTDPTDGVVYDKTISLIAPPTQANWYSYFFDPITRSTQALFVGMPSYASATIEILVTADSGTAAIGVLTMGRETSVGTGVLSGARTGIVDYSIKAKDDFGDYTIVQRSWSKKAAFRMLVPASECDSLQDFLASMRGIPMVWIGSELRSSMVIYGFYKDFDILNELANHSIVSIEIEGLT